MKPVRSLLALACLVGFAAPSLAQNCLQPSERVALEVRSLQNRLMVGALACQQQDGYNAFVRRNQGDLNNAYRTAQSHFRSRGGEAAWNRVDTDIAASQAQEQGRLGGFFCRDNATFLEQLASVSGTADLARFAVERNILQPHEAPTCTGAAFGRPQRAAAAPRR